MAESKPQSTESRLTHRVDKIAEPSTECSTGALTGSPTASPTGQLDRHHGPRAAGEMQRQVQRIAQTTLTTLLTGESGTGKSTIAKQIHSLGPRADEPFVVVNCASLPRELIEAELFGHARGAFTGAISDREGRIEAANGGTLLLDEIGDMPIELQPKLLTFLQDQTFQRIGSNQVMQADVRVIAATNQDLVELCRERRFREDLYFRLNVLSLHVAPLRDRREAVPELVQHVLVRIAEQVGEPVSALEPEALHALMHYDWPGNIRELENILQRACLFRRDEMIRLGDLTFDQFAAADESTGALPVPRGFTFAGKTLSEIEKIALVETLEACSGNKAKAARNLGISERSIYNKLKRYELSY